MLLWFSFLPVRANPFPVALLLVGPVLHRERGALGVEVLEKGLAPGGQMGKKGIAQELKS